MARFDINSEEQMKELYEKMRPVGSGPLGLMRITCDLIESIAAEKGFSLHDDQEKEPS